jgi:hypothetical protein
MKKVTVGDLFKVMKEFRFINITYRKGEGFRIVSVNSAYAMRGGYSITITDMSGNKRVMVGAEKFGEYMRDGYFIKITDSDREDDIMGEFKLQVGDIVMTKENFFTVVSDSEGRLCVFNHKNFQFLYIALNTMYINEEDCVHEIIKVYRHSTVSYLDYDFDWDSICKDTQVYPPIKKVKLTLSEIKKQFQIENCEVEIDFEN